MNIEERCMAALNRITKWRNVFAGWQLGTRLKSDPECQAVKDHREVTILLRVEGNTLIKLLLDKGVFTAEEWHQTMTEEADMLSKDYEEKFPGMRAVDDGIEYYRRAIETMKNWKP